MREHIEFDALIEDGKIVVPPVYAEAVRTAKQVHISLTGEGGSRRHRDFIDDLLENPLKLSGFRKMSRDEMHTR
jgi:hypothetical protein